MYGEIVRTNEGDSAGTKTKLSIYLSNGGDTAMKNYLSIYLSNERDTAMNRTMVRSVLTNEQRSYQHESWVGFQVATTLSDEPGQPGQTKPHSTGPQDNESSRVGLEW